MVRDSRWFWIFIVILLVSFSVGLAQDDSGSDGPTTEIVIGDDDRGKIVSTRTAPYTGIVQILTRGTWCTGSLIHQSYVITAAHCMTNANGSLVEANDLTVIAARNGFAFPYGIRAVSQLWVAQEWLAEDDFGWDVAVLELATPYTSEEHTIFNLYAASDAYLNDSSRVFGLYGYPADQTFGEMWGMQRAGLDGNTKPDNIFPTIVTYTLDTFGGQSGSSLWTRNTGGGYDLVGIHSYGDAKSVVNGATRIRAEVLARLDAWGVPYNGNATLLNDTPEAALEIGGALPYMGQVNTTNAASDVTTQCDGHIGKDVFYQLVVPYSGMLQVTTQGSNFDTQVAVARIEPGQPIVSSGCNNDHAGTAQSLLRVNVVEGETYIIQAGGRGDIGGELVINAVILPPNDKVADAKDISNQLPYSTRTGNAGAATDVKTACNGEDIGGDVFYKFTANFSGQVTVDTDGSDFDTQLAVFSLPPQDNSDFIDCNDDTASSITSRVSFGVVTGNTYYIQVGGYEEARGNLTVTVTNTLPPSNDTPMTATDVTALLPFIEVTTTQNAISNIATLCESNTISKDVFYWLTPTTHGVLTVDTFNSDFDTQIALFQGVPGAGGTNLACNDDAGGFVQSQLAYRLDEAVPYYIQVGGYRMAGGDLTVNVRLAPALPEDANNDGFVTPADMVYVVNRIGGESPGADVNNDGLVNETDVALVGAALGAAGG